MTESRFRKILWLYIGFTLAAIVAAFFPHYSERLAQAYAKEPEPFLAQSLAALITLITVGSALWVTGIVGLFRFKRWGRSLSLYLTAVGLALTPFLGASLYSGVEEVLMDVASMLCGAILAISYFSDINKRFAR